MVNVHRKLSKLLTNDNVINLRQHFEEGARVTSRGVRKILGDFEYVSGEIVYTPLDLLVLDKEQKAVVLKHEYNDLVKSVGKGIAPFYKRLSSEYANLTRDECESFLKTQAGYQLRKQPQKVVNRPILASQAGEKVECDEVDMSRWEYRGYKYFVTVVDVATRFIWLRALKTQTASEFTDRFEEICEEESFKPQQVVTDNGGSFRKEFTQFCKDNGIKQSFTKSYSPNATGLVESINQQARRMLMDCLTRGAEGSDDWPKYLKVVESAWNSSVHGRRKHTPELLFMSQNADVEDERREAVAELQEQARKRVALNQSKELHVGNVVRVLLRATSTKIRKTYKDLKTRKYIPIQWSTELYCVRSVVAQDRNRPEGTAKRQYTLETLEGEPLNTEALKTDARTRVRRPARFFASELQFIAKNKDAINDEAYTDKRLENLNRPVSGDGKRVSLPIRRVRKPAERRPRQPTPFPVELKRSERTRRAPAYLRDYET